MVLVCPHTALRHHQIIIGKFIFTNIKNQIISEYKINNKELSFVPNHIYNKGYIYKDHFIFDKKKLNDFAIFVGANEEVAESCYRNSDGFETS